MPERTCSLPGCERKHCARGMCRPHYQRWYVTGSTELVPREPAPARLCSVEGCTAEHAAKDLCGKHYQRLVTRGWVEDTPKAGTVFDCSIEGCEKPHLARGWCVTHYNRWKAQDDPLAPKRVPQHQMPCTIDACERPRRKRGLCELHSRRAAKGTAMDARIRGVDIPPCLMDGCDAISVSFGLCRSHYGKRYAAGKRDELLRRNKERYLSVPAEERRRRRAEHYQANRDRIRERAQARYREIYPNDPTKWRAAKSRRKMRLDVAMTAEDRHISEDYRRAIVSDPCFYCGTTETAHVDHFYPLSKGGTDHWRNLRRTCGPCNLSKNARCGTWFILRRGTSEFARPVPPLSEAG